MSAPTSILLVDDDRSLLRTTRMILEHRGFAVTTAHDGEDAIQKTRDSAFDLTFVDIKMPGIDGVETLEHLKRLRPSATIVMMSAYAGADEMRRSLELGAHGVLSKPLDMGHLMDLVRRAVDGTEGCILVVEDDDANALTFSSILSEKGYDVGLARTGEEAVEFVQSKKFEVVFLDLRLPGMSGVSTYKAIRDSDPDVTVVLITAYRSELDAQVRETLSLSARRCLDKPLDMAVVLELLDEIQGESKS